MNFSEITISNLYIPFALLAGFLLAGFLVEFIVVTFLEKLAKKTKWEVDDIIINSIDKIVVFLFFVIGAYFAERNLGLVGDDAEVARKVVLVMLIFAITLYIARVIAGLINLISKNGKGAFPAASIFANFTRLIVFVIGLLMALSVLGISVTPLLTALGVGGLAVALALQETLSNLFSGLQVVASRKVKANQYIKLDSGEEGYIDDITWRYTTIHDLPGNLIIIPNSKLANSIITNYYKPETDMAVLLDVGVSYGSDLEKVEYITISVAKEIMQKSQGGVPDFEPVIRFHTFGDFSIQFTVILRVQKFVDQYYVKHEFVKLLHKTYEKEGIEIPFPIRTVEIKNHKA
ncbi:MAG: mechanosensitive ion channel family protein [Candidatus Dojkabacteria bacterium]